VTCNRRPSANEEHRERALTTDGPAGAPGKKEGALFREFTKGYDFVRRDDWYCAYVDCVYAVDDELQAPVSYKEYCDRLRDRFPYFRERARWSQPRDLVRGPVDDEEPAGEVHPDALALLERRAQAQQDASQRILHDQRLAADSQKWQRSVRRRAFRSLKKIAADKGESAERRRDAQILVEERLDQQRFYRRVRKDFPHLDECTPRVAYMRLMREVLPNQADRQVLQGGHVEAAARENLFATLRKLAEVLTREENGSTRLKRRDEVERWLALTLASDDRFVPPEWRGWPHAAEARKLLQQLGRVAKSYQAVLDRKSAFEETMNTALDLLRACTDPELELGALLLAAVKPLAKSGASELAGAPERFLAGLLACCRGQPPPSSADGVEAEVFALLPQLARRVRLLADGDIDPIDIEKHVQLAFNQARRTVLEES
jgi:hypothetical protein